MSNRINFANLCGRVVAVFSAAMLLQCASALATEAANRLSSNKLASNRLAASRLAADRLAANQLEADRPATDRLDANGRADERPASVRLEVNGDTAAMLHTEEGREVYSYIIGCALGQNTKIEADVPEARDTAPPDTLYSCKNGRCAFSGSIGLAEHWIDRPLNRNGQRWVTACLLSRVNHFGVTEIFSMRGAASALSVSPREAEQYSLQEGAFYGNIFSDDADAPLDWNACRGTDKAATPNRGELAMRDCTEPDPDDRAHTVCGFKYAGDCGATRAFSPRPACATFDPEDGTFGECLDMKAEGHDSSIELYRQVITTYVKP